MDTQIVRITLYHPESRLSWDIYAEQVSANRFRMFENDIFDVRLSIGTEFLTEINSNGEHIVSSIVKESPFVRRHFIVSKEFVEGYFKPIEAATVQAGGFWQIDFGGVLTVNVPIDSTFDLDEKMHIAHAPSDAS